MIATIHPTQDGFAADEESGTVVERSRERCKEYGPHTCTDGRCTRRSYLLENLPNEVRVSV